jgi:hypothetical protein
LSKLTQTVGAGVGFTENVGASVKVGDGEGAAVVEKDPPPQAQQRSPAVKSSSSA